MAINDQLSYERNIAAVVREARELRTILNRSGAILYSSCETLKPGKYYFLGLNPGGSEADKHTIQQSLDELVIGTSTKNAYLDEDWSSDRRSYDKECHPLQKNFKCLFQALGENPRDVCASNLIFKRSPDEQGAEYPDLAELCWPVHKAILEIVRPSAIITFGFQPFEFVTKQLGGGYIESFNSGHGKWKWRSLIREGKPSLIGLPHLSKYALWCRPKVVEKVRSLIG
jgi:hypothetical protein